MPRLPSPFEVDAPAGAEGWERMYPPHMLFSEENRAWEEGALWFRDAMHHPEPMYPFDAIEPESWRIGVSGVSHRLFAVPPSYGLENRVHNGFLYVTAVGVSDPQRIADRTEVFVRRAGFYYQRWGELYANWQRKEQALIEEIKGIHIPSLPGLEAEEVVTSARGTTSGYHLIEAYGKVIDNLLRAWQGHFELHNIAYGAFANLFFFLHEIFPGIKDQVVADMVGGDEYAYFRPDDELRKLAALAVELGVHERLREPGSPEDVLARLASDRQGERWVGAFEAAKDPWFSFSTGTGLSHRHRSWIDDLTVPWASMLSYVDRLERGESIERPRSDVLERRDAVTAGYRELLGGDEQRQAFDENVGLARTVAPYLQDHALYHEHWHHTAFWNRIREFGDRLVTAGFLDDREDVFLLNRWELGQAVYEAVATWATGAPVRGQVRWRREVADRKRILAALSAWTAPPALGTPPEEIHDPISLMLFGITPDRVAAWLAEPGDMPDDFLRGVAASPGVAEGPARVVMIPEQLDEVEPGEIIVSPLTAPAWTPVFGRVAGAVSDMGGIMSHTAIVSREYGLPAVTGTGNATTTIRTGDRVVVDGSEGIVRILRSDGSNGSSDSSDEARAGASAS
jgi:pyruvate, water dikinase